MRGGSRSRARRRDVRRDRRAASRLLVGVALAGPLSELLLGTRDAPLMAYGLLGLWAFTNLEIAYALLRVEERRRAYVIAGVSQRAADRRR